MARSVYVLAALFAASSVPAFGAVTVIGNSLARECFEAAESPMQPTMNDVRLCDEAFSGEAMSQHDTVATYVNRGILKLRRNQVDAAIADFDQAIQIDPTQPEAYLNKGSALIRANHSADAIGLFTVALEHNTERPELAHFGRAIANEDMGNVREAYNDYRRASELDPNWAEPRTELRRFRVVSQ